MHYGPNLQPWEAPEFSFDRPTLLKGRSRSPALTRLAPHIEDSVFPAKIAFEQTRRSRLALGFADEARNAVIDVTRHSCRLAAGHFQSDEDSA